MKIRSAVLLSIFVCAYISVWMQADPRSYEKSRSHSSSERLSRGRSRELVGGNPNNERGSPSYTGVYNTGSAGLMPDIPPPPPTFAIGNMPVQTAYNVVHYPAHTETPWNLYSYPHVFDPYHGHLHPFHPLHPVSYFGPYSNPGYMMMSMMHPYGFTQNPYINPFMMGMHPAMTNPMMMQMMNNLANPMLNKSNNNRHDPLTMGLLNSGLMGGAPTEPSRQGESGPSGYPFSPQQAYQNPEDTGNQRSRIPNTQDTRELFSGQFNSYGYQTDPQAYMQQNRANRVL